MRFVPLSDFGSLPMALEDDLVLYYTCDETGGTRVDEINAYDLTAVGAVPAVAGIIGNGCDFASGGVHLERASAAVSEWNDEPQTINAWVQINAGTQFNTQGKVGKGTTANEYYLRYRAGGFNRWEYTTGSAIARANTFGAVPTGSLMMVTCIHDPVANILSIQVNNGTADTTAHTTGLLAGTENFQIGRGGGGNSIGIVDEVGIWRRVLTAGEITQLYNGGAGLRPTFAVDDEGPAYNYYWQDRTRRVRA